MSEARPSRLNSESSRSKAANDADRKNKNKGIHGVSRLSGSRSCSIVLVVFIYSVGRGKQQVGLQLRAGAAAVSSLCGELIIQI